MPRRSDHRFHTEMVYHICDLFVRERESLELVIEIRLEIYLFDIWHTLPYDMMLVMRHVVGSLILI